ncbi:unnamed protein product [Cuscuta epithymum]|uniref:Uncharacterized protein n=1 Tax=Cuscuta epithymum TaxID=186058 RepID=A0AAV0DX03_9ASTE|nr:unnamed protein product [Cuscuta epithymum]
MCLHTNDKRRLPSHQR